MVSKISIEALQCQIQNLQGTLKEKEKQIQEIDALNTRINSENVDWQRLQRQVELDVQDPLKANPKSLLLKIGEQRRKIGELERECKKIAEDFQKSDKDNNTLLARFHILNINVGQLSSENDDLTAENLDLKSELEKTKSEFSDFVKKTKYEKRLEQCTQLVAQNFKFDRHLFTQVLAKQLRLYREIIKAAPRESVPYYAFSRCGGTLRSTVIVVQAAKGLLVNYDPFPIFSEFESWGEVYRMVTLQELQNACSEKLIHLTDLDLEQVIEQALIELLQKKMQERGFDAPDYPFPSLKIVLSNLAVQSLQLRLYIILSVVGETITAYTHQRLGKRVISSITSAWGEMGVKLTSFFAASMSQEQKARAQASFNEV